VGRPYTVHLWNQTSGAKCRERHAKQSTYGAGVIPAGGKSSPRGGIPRIRGGSPCFGGRLFSKRSGRFGGLATQREQGGGSTGVCRMVPCHRSPGGSGESGSGAKEKGRPGEGRPLKTIDFGTIKRWCREESSRRPVSCPSSTLSLPFSNPPCGFRSPQWAVLYLALHPPNERAVFHNRDIENKALTGGWSGDDGQARLRRGENYPLGGIKSPSGRPPCDLKASCDTFRQGLPRR